MVASRDVKEEEEYLRLVIEPWRRLREGYVGALVLDGGRSVNNQRMKTIIDYGIVT